MEKVETQYRIMLSLVLNKLNSLILNPNPTYNFKLNTDPDPDPVRTQGFGDQKFKNI
jgi:hypothetical protein